MKRRQFIIGLSGAAAWPVVARGQQAERMRRIGVLMGTSDDDQDGQARLATFLQGLQELGWTNGRNLHVDTRWSPGGDPVLARKHAAELLALSPDVLLASGTSHMAPLQLLTNTTPIVFVAVVDPVGAGFVASLAHPGGNATGFVMFEYGISAKWLELLKQVAPNVDRVAVVRNPSITSGIGQFAVIQSVASSLGVELSPIDVRDTSEIERTLTAFARTPNGGVVVTLSQAALQNRNAIIEATARHHLPAVYPNQSFVTGGGLAAYGVNYADQYRGAASYVDRILKGEKPSELAVQRPTKFELSINLRTARTLGLSIPPTLIATANEIVE